MNKTNKVIALSAALIGVCLLVIYMGIIETGVFAKIPIAWSFTAVGFLTFFGIFIISFILEETSGNKNNKIRNSIAGSLLMVYIYLMAVYIFDEGVTMETEETKYIINNFTNLFGIVIVSYFGTSAVETYIGKKKEEAKNPQVPK